MDFDAAAVEERKEDVDRFCADERRIYTIDELDDCQIPTTQTKEERESEESKKQGDTSVTLTPFRILSLAVCTPGKEVDPAW